LKPIGNDEISGKSSAEPSTKSMEGLAITRDGRASGHHAECFDSGRQCGATKLLRIVAVDIASGHARIRVSAHYRRGVSEIVAMAVTSS
jgi:hypothetical protein